MKPKSQTPVVYGSGKKVIITEEAKKKADNRKKIEIINEEKEFDDMNKEIWDEK